MQITSRLVVSNRILEYFVVFIIIVAMTAISFALLRSILAETRDSERIGDIATMRTALELYHIDRGEYPHTGLATERGNFSFVELTGAEGIYGVKAP